ncbi:hypothetical protein [Methylobacterium sp. yr668]|uniref:hypothetical protein n=1 Tax=Methylobacterium sp. yr668 TaxID=1761801 RepID=UPI001114904A|nr:hypothetical protein [Methylobacterium sp. yr668]
MKIFWRFADRREEGMLFNFVCVKGNDGLMPNRIGKQPNNYSRHKNAKDNECCRPQDGRDHVSGDLHDDQGGGHNGDNGDHSPERNAEPVSPSGCKTDRLQWVAEKQHGKSEI